MVDGKLDEVKYKKILRKTQNPLSEEATDFRQIHQFTFKQDNSKQTTRERHSHI